jgi:murein DD-endopeptidase MepM/ murein hydrolase activator NlpD
MLKHLFTSLLMLSVVGLPGLVNPSIARTSAISPLAPSSKMRYPLPQVVAVSSRFGLRQHPVSGLRRPHTGIDLAADYGMPVLAASPGRVIYSGDYGNYGNVVAIEHGPNLITLYAHLSEVYVQPGTWVEQSTSIAAVGSSGTATGPHLHFEVRFMDSTGKWFALDPGSYLDI